MYITVLRVEMRLPNCLFCSLRMKVKLLLKKIKYKSVNSQRSDYARTDVSSKLSDHIHELVHMYVNKDTCRSRNREA